MQDKYIMKAIEYARNGMFVQPELTKEIISKIDTSINASILVLFSYEMLPILSGLGYQNVTLAFDKPRTSIYNIAKCYRYQVKTFEEITNMKFDVVIGNPPYQKIKGDGSRYDQASNLWSVFWSESINKFSKPDGKVVLITPTSWLSPSIDLKGKYKINGFNRLWDYFSSVTSYADVKNVSKHFNVGSTFGYVYVDKSGRNGLRFSDKALTKLGFLPISGTEEVLQKLDRKNNLVSKFKLSQTTEPKLRVRFPITKTLKPDMIEIANGKINKDDPTLYYNVYVDNRKQAKKVQAIIQDSIAILNKHCKWSGFINLKIVQMLKYVE
jgi:hypothetical protein